MQKQQPRPGAAADASCFYAQLSSAEAEQRTKSETASKTQRLKDSYFKTSPSSADEPLRESDPATAGERERSTLWSPCDLTRRHESYLERRVILSDFDRHRIWHLGAVISYRYQRVVDETRVVCGVPCCHQDQEPVTSQSKRQTCSLLGKQPGGFSQPDTLTVAPSGPARTRPPPGA